MCKGQALSLNDYFVSTKDKTTKKIQAKQAKKKNNREKNVFSVHAYV